MTTDQITKVDRWWIDRAEVEEIVKHLGLRIGVNIEFDETLGEGVGGCYRGLRDGLHDIAMNPRISAGRASSALVHEFVHAAQFEERGEAAWLEWCAAETAREPVGDLRAYEVEAYARGDRLHRRFSPVSKVRGEA